jgi:hypothetical protein
MFEDAYDIIKFKLYTIVIFLHAYKRGMGDCAYLKNSLGRKFTNKKELIVRTK